MPAQLRGCFGQPVEPGRQPHFELLVIRNRVSRDEGGRKHGFGVLLLGIVQEPGEGNHGIGGQGSLGVADGRFALGPERRHQIRLLAVHGPNGTAGRPDGLSAGRQPGFPRPVDISQLAPGPLHQLGQFGAAVVGTARGSQVSGGGSQIS